jgi:hypothetical protein
MNNFKLMFPEDAEPLAKIAAAERVYMESLKRDAERYAILRDNIHFLILFDDGNTQMSVDCERLDEAIDTQRGNS